MTHLCSSFARANKFLAPLEAASLADEGVEEEDEEGDGVAADEEESWWRLEKWGMVWWW